MYRKEGSMQIKSDEQSGTYGAGDLMKRLGEFGNRVRKKYIRRRTNSSIENIAEPNLTDESRSTLSITPKLVEIMLMGTSEDQMRGVKFIRKLLSSPRPLIDEVTEAGLVPVLVALLKCPSDLMQYEAAWALTNILSGTSLHVRYVIEAGALEAFIALLSSSNEDVQEQCAWALGNIAGDLDDFRAHALEKGAMFGLLNMMENTASMRLLQTGAWAVSNLCVNNPDFKSIAPAIPVLISFLGHDNVDFIYNCTLALAHLSDGVDRVQTIINHQGLIHIVKLLAWDKECLFQPLLKIIVNVSSGTKEQIDCLMRCDILPPLRKHFDSRKETFRYKATLIVANMAAGTVEHIDYIIRSTATISRILSCIGNDSERVVKQAINTLKNISIGGNESQILCLTDKCVVNKLCQVLKSADTPTILSALICLERLLNITERRVQREGSYNDMALSIEECSGLESIEELQSHSNKDIYHKAYEIMEKYFTTEEVTEQKERPKFP